MTPEPPAGDASPPRGAARRPEGARGPAPASAHEPPQPARDLSVHLLRMLETRMEAAGMALQSEGQRWMSRLRLSVFAGVAVLFAGWAGIVLLAVALPPEWRVPGLAILVGALVVTGAILWRMARRQATSADVGSLRWLASNLRRDVDVLARTLSGPPPAARPSPDSGSAPNDLAA